MNQAYLTTADLAARYHTSPETVRYWRYTGYGPTGIKIGRKVLYPKADVERWEAERRAPERGLKP